MAETKDKLVDLEDLKALSDDTTAKLGGKLAVPTNEGTEGQVLTAKGDGTSEWKTGFKFESETPEGMLGEKSMHTSGLNQDGVSTPRIYLDSQSKENEHKNAHIEIKQTGFTLPNSVPESIIDLSSSKPDKDNERDLGYGLSFSSYDGYLNGTTGPSIRFYRSGRTDNWNSDVKLLYSENSLYVLKTSTNSHSIVKDAFVTPSLDVDIPGPCKGDETTVSMEIGTGTLSVKEAGITMSHLAQDVKDAISAGGGGGTTVDEATIRRIVNEQLAKMKFTINDQGHLIIETPEA